jgi:hypothetical protein
MRAKGAEGIVSNRLGSAYKSGLCHAWVKVKNPDAVAFGDCRTSASFRGRSRKCSKRSPRKIAKLPPYIRVSITDHATVP